MKRIVKFRGKSKRTGEWLYGDLVRNVEGAFAIVPPFEMTTDNLCDRYEVDKETVGQSTGLYDENESEIYEGDIVDFTFHYTGHCGDYAVKCDTIGKGIVQWYQGGFVLKVIDNDFEDTGQYVSNVSIIGNIYDNKELLK